MTRSNKGNYGAKHPEGTQVDDSLARAVSKAMVKEKIACKAAFDIAQRLNTAPLEVGKAIDLQEGHIQACQLGLFGYGQPENRVQKSKEVPQNLETAIQKSLVEGRLQCQEAWRIADTLQFTRIEVSRACEALEISIGQCQLCAF